MAHPFSEFPVKDNQTNECLSIEDVEGHTGKLLSAI